MFNLKPNPSFSDFQDYIKKMETERGFSKETVTQKCILLFEEIGELFEACFEKTESKSDELQLEIADVIVLLTAIANRLNVNLSKAIKNSIYFENADFSENVSVSNYQKYIEENSPKESFVSSVLSTLVSEIGLLCKTIRKKVGIKTNPNAEFSNLSEKFADIFAAVFMLGNVCNINIEEAFRKKEEINKQRQWS